jgi:hypothetical protein
MKTCSARLEPLDLEKTFSTVLGSAFLGILILYLFVSTDISREIQVGILLLVHKSDFALQKTKNIPAFTK